MNKEFTKQDLKAGMLVELRNKDLYLVVPHDEHKELILVGNGYWSTLQMYNDDLTSKININYDIVKVYSYIRYFDFNTTGRTLLWERKEKEQIRKENIKKKNEMLEQREKLIKEIEDKFNQLNVLNDSYLQFMDEHFKWDSEYYLPSDKYFRKHLMM